MCHYFSMSRRVPEISQGLLVHHAKIFIFYFPLSYPTSFI